MIDSCLGDPARLRPADPRTLFSAVVPRQLKMRISGIELP